MEKIKMFKIPLEYVTELVHDREEFSEDLAILKMYWQASNDGNQSIPINGKERFLEYNEFLTSASHLAMDWKWSEDCVYKFLYTLSSGYTRHIEVEELAGHQDFLIITMLKYDEFVVTA